MQLLANFNSVVLKLRAARTIGGQSFATGHLCSRSEQVRALDKALNSYRMTCSDISVQRMQCITSTADCSLQHVLTV